MRSDDYSIPVEEAIPTLDYTPVNRCNARQMAIRARYDLGSPWIVIFTASGLKMPLLIGRQHRKILRPLHPRR